MNAIKYENFIIKEEFLIIAIIINSKLQQV